ncbi:MAG: tRNA lysidine(34) synthetase TilS [Deltaproteobacteria bacterium]|nr:tRNA lysidine(34) synthetase TilS [Deltaproteobacteria bacterium]
MSDLFAKVTFALKHVFASRHDLHLGVAVSGGPDSVALLGVLYELVWRKGGRLTVLHVNHQLRPEADQEQQLVEKLCQQWQLPCLVETLVPPSPHSGIEAWAREERYRFFHQAKTLHGLDAVAVAHTADDQAETVLFRLLRGAGPRGLAGMPPMRDGWIIRPLLTCSRSEVVAYLAEKQLSFAIDTSNEDLQYTRNKIRHVLLPFLEQEFSPQIRRHLLQLAESLRQEEDWIEAQAQAAYARVHAGGGRLSLPRLLTEPSALRPRIFRLWLGQAGHSGDLSFRHFKNLAALSERRIRGVVELPGAYTVQREGEFLALANKTSQPLLPSPYSYLLEPGCILTIPEIGWVLSVSSCLSWEGDLAAAHVSDLWQAIFDVDALSAPLVVRNWQAGDRIRPFNMHGQRKIHDIFIDKKIALRQRRVWPLVTCGEEIFWAPGCVRGEQAAVTGATQRVVRLAANPLPEKQKLC